VYQLQIKESFAYRETMISGKVLLQDIDCMKKHCKDRFVFVQNFISCKKN